MNTTQDPTHSFSRDLANRYGVNAAIILGYIGHKIQHSKQVHEGKRWYYDTLDKLSERYPYLSRTAIHDAIKSLTQNNGPLITGNFNKKGYDRTTWYAFRDQRTAQQLHTAPIYFKQTHAVKYGVLGAVLIQNLTYWIAEKRKEQPGYRFHPVPPKTLEKHLPFSDTTIQRALANLVEEDVLVPQKPDEARKPMQYGFADGFQYDVTSSGSNPNETESAQAAQNQIPDMATSIQDMSGSIPDLASSIQNMGDSNPDNNTILIDNHLKASCLKEGSLKEDHFKASAVDDSSHSLSADDKSNADAKSTSASNQGIKSFCEPLASPVPSLGQTNADPLPSTVQVSSTKSDAPLVPLPVPVPSASQAQVPITPLWLKRLIGRDCTDRPDYLFLDESVHNACWKVMQFHSNSTDELHEGIAAGIVHTAEKLIKQTDPEFVYRLSMMANQADLNAALKPWYAPFFEKAYADMATKCGQQFPDEYHQMFLEHGLCFLNMAFYEYRWDRNTYCGTHYYYDISLAIFGRISPWAEERHNQQKTAILQQRALQFVSPDKDKETVADLSPAEKMQVFNQSLQSRNRIGKFNRFNKFTEDVVVITKNTLNLARQFFQLNPDFTVAHLNRVLDACLQMPDSLLGEKETDPQWHARNAYKISLFLTSLQNVASELNLLSQLPPFTPLPVKEEEDV